MDVAAIAGPGPVSGPARPAAGQAGEVAKEFEALLVGQLFEHMFDGLGASGLFGGGQAERTWRGFMLQEYARSVAQSGDLGIAPLVEAEVARLYAGSMESGE
ncbi:rod-binding protein [Arenibaculum sp.]|jgi:Rod binding domain-containing protein|uniref:rod-binding protein n=1 Tax=Arenibaculum sp. TaxID=2865862 RepID=UPI002E123D89|nr:rod-binding protein [Arenibaculum sp.]